MATCSTVYQVPGQKGSQGAAGTNGTDGVNAYTQLAVQFTMPAELASDTATVDNSDFLVLGQIVYLESLGYLEVSAIPDSTSVTLINLEDAGSDAYLTNAAPGNVAPVGAKLSPAGLQGEQGTAGTGGSPDTGTYITQVPLVPPGFEQALSLLATGYVKNTTGTGVLSVQAVPIPIADGGTAGTNATTAFNALSPVTTRGDIIVRGAANNQRLAVGAANRVLRSDGTDPLWGQVVLTTDVTGILPVANGGTGSASGSASGGHAFRAYLNASQALAGIATRIIFDTESFDVSAAYNNATGVYTAPTTGKYLFQVKMLTGGVVNTYTVRVNTVSVYQVGITLTDYSASVLLSLTAGDAVDVYTTGLADNIYGVTTGVSRSEFSGFRII